MIQAITDATGKELSSAEIHAAFEREYLEATTPVGYTGHRAQHSTDGSVEHLAAHLVVNGVETVLHGAGNGPVDAFVAAIRTGLGLPIHVVTYHEHAIGAGEDATAVAYVQLRVGTDRTVYGVGRDANIVTAALRALTSAINRGVHSGVLVLAPAKEAATA